MNGFTLWLMGFALFALGMSAGGLFVAEAYRAQAVERGHALYCPADGDFAWVGECDK